MPFEETVEKRLQDYEKKISKHLLKEKIEKIISSTLYLVLSLGLIGLLYYMNQN